jgi:hypothetical protein
LSWKGFECDPSTTQVGNVTTLENLLSVGQVKKNNKEQKEDKGGLKANEHTLKENEQKKTEKKNTLKDISKEKVEKG